MAILITEVQFIMNHMTVFLISTNTFTKKVLIFKEFYLEKDSKMKPAGWGAGGN